MDFLRTGPDDARSALMLAHGAGAPMDSPFMAAISEALALQGVAVIRFEFAYMATRRTGGRKPPPRAERLMGEYIEVVREIGTAKTLFIGGKSMGGRVASMVAADLHRSDAIAGLVCLGYPFHPPAKPAALRTAHLQKLAVPALICQGTRDPFGTSEEVPGYRLSTTIEIAWLEDGDHDFKPRKASGLTQAGHIGTAAAAIAEWMRRTVTVQS